MKREHDDDIVDDDVQELRELIHKAFSFHNKLTKNARTRQSLAMKTEVKKAKTGLQQCADDIFAKALDISHRQPLTKQTDVVHMPIPGMTKNASRTLYETLKVSQPDKDAVFNAAEHFATELRKPLQPEESYEDDCLWIPSFAELNEGALESEASIRQQFKKLELDSEEKTKAFEEEFEQHRLDYANRMNVDEMDGVKKEEKPLQEGTIQHEAQVVFKQQLDEFYGGDVTVQGAGAYHLPEQ